MIVHSSHFIMAGTAMFIGAAVATPLPDRLAALMKRQGGVSWTSADGGNINMFFSDDKVNFGVTNPVDIIRNNVSLSCNDYGLCSSETVDVGPSQYGDGPNDEDISYTVDGQYPSYIHNGFIDLLAGVMQNQTTTDQACVTNSCPSVESYCPGGEGSQSCYTEYTAPRHIGVVFNNNDPSSTPSAMQVDFTITTDSDGGLCSDFTTLGAVLTGLVPEVGGAASGLFTLGGLGCSD